MVGHCDIVYKDKVISYGNYDTSSERLFGAIGDGVMFISNLKKYIDNVSFGKDIENFNIKQIKASAESTRRRPIF